MMNQSISGGSRALTARQHTQGCAHFASAARPCRRRSSCTVTAAAWSPDQSLKGIAVSLAAGLLLASPVLAKGARLPPIDRGALFREWGRTAFPPDTPLVLL